MYRAMALHNIAAQTMAAREARRSFAAMAGADKILRGCWSRKALRSLRWTSILSAFSEAAAAGESVVFGDAARREVLIAAGLMRAAAVVVSYADTASALRILHLVNELRPGVPVDREDGR